VTDRECFEAVRAHLLAQGRRATLGDTGRCRYRVVEPDGTVLRCAVGCLVPEEEYVEGIEGCPAHDIAPFLTDAGVLPPCAARPDAHARRLTLLQRLQRVHDAVDPAGWRDALDRQAGSFHPDGALAALPTWDETVAAAGLIGLIGHPVPPK